MRSSTTNYNLLAMANVPSVSGVLTNLQRRIVDISDYRVFGSLHQDDFIHLYSNSKLEDNDEIARCGAYDHTMFESIDTYCGQKFPVEFVKQALLDGRKFEIHGIFPDHFQAISTRLGYTEVKEIEFNHNKRVKRFNFIRPKFFLCRNANGERAFVAAVNCGRDYVFHYASMLKHVVGMYSLVAADAIEVYRYPLAEASIHKWTNLDSTLINRGDVVIIGYAQEVDEHFKSCSSLQRLEEAETEYYTSIRYKNEYGQVINLIGIKFSFWGCISAKIATRLCRLGAKEIIYVGKLGTLSKPSDIYERIFVPSEFLIMYHDKIVCHVTDLPNGLLAHMPDLSTGCHVSVPTVVEEDYIQRAITNNLGIDSIDNEISQIAYAVAQFNQDFESQISFSAMHFATDYIRRPEEKSLKVEHDLSNNRSRSATTKKAAIFGRMLPILASYISTKGVENAKN